MLDICLSGLEKHAPGLIQQHACPDCPCKRQRDKNDKAIHHSPFFRCVFKEHPKSGGAQYWNAKHGYIEKARGNAQKMEPGQSVYTMVDRVKFAETDNASQERQYPEKSGPRIHFS